MSRDARDTQDVIMFSSRGSCESLLVFLKAKGTRKKVSASFITGQKRGSLGQKPFFLGSPGQFGQPGIGATVASL